MARRCLGVAQIVVLQALLTRTNVSAPFKLNKSRDGPKQSKSSIWTIR